MQKTSASPVLRVRVNLTPVMSQPTSDAVRTSEALYGETVELLSRHGNWLRIRQQRDGYEGYLEGQHLQVMKETGGPVNTHWVTQRSTLLFQQADIKSPLKHRLPFGAELALTGPVSDTFSQSACGHFIWTTHCLPLAENHSSEPLVLAESLFLGTPYLWGGRTPEGIDCSGLVQMLARSQGFALPRDSADQEAFLHSDVTAEDYRDMDLVFWPGHTGILLSPTEILHATAHSLCCIIEPLADVIARAGQVSSVKRLFR